MEMNFRWVAAWADAWRRRRAASEGTRQAFERASSGSAISRLALASSGSPAIYFVVAGTRGGWLKKAVSGLNFLGIVRAGFAGTSRMLLELK